MNGSKAISNITSYSSLFSKDEWSQVPMKVTKGKRGFWAFDGCIVTGEQAKFCDGTMVEICLQNGMNTYTHMHTL